MKLASTIAAAALIALTACGGDSQAENAADRLEEAAEQSDPAAAQVLENAADNVQAMEGAAAMNAAQEALDEAANAQIATPPTPAPPSMQAQPNRTGQQTPPPKTRAAVPSGNNP